MSYTIAADVAKLEEVASQIQTYRGELETALTNIFTQIDGLHESWKGASFETFYNECYSYASSLEALVVLLDAYALLLSGDVTGNATDFIAAAESALDLE